MNLRKSEWRLLQRIAHDTTAGKVFGEKVHIRGRGLARLYGRLYARGLIRYNEPYGVELTDHGREVVRTFEPPAHWAIVAA